jgi:4'-phosphopantetheinyl transferase
MPKIIFQTLKNFSPLKKKEIYLWPILFSEQEKDFNDLYQKLNSKEQENAEKFKVAGAKRSFVVTRGMLRVILSKYLNCDASKLFFIRNKFGKPELKNNQTKIFFNVSHSKQAALLGFSLDGEIGVDLELIQPGLDFLGLAKRILTPKELKHFLGVREADRAKIFYAIWVAKEAVIKAIGQGFSCPMYSFELVLAKELLGDFEVNFLSGEKFNLHGNIFLAFSNHLGAVVYL